MLWASTCWSISQRHLLVQVFNVLLCVPLYTILYMASRDKRIQVVLSDKEFEWFKAYTNSQSTSMSEFLRDHIKELMKTNTKG